MQLPIFYYPNLLKIEVNHKVVSYFPIPYQNTVLAGISLPAGKYEIKAAFIGIWWANWLSAFAWIILVGFLVTHLFFKLTLKVGRV